MKTQEHIFFVSLSGSLPERERPVCFEPGQTLAQAVYLSGLFQAPALCSGLGRCGRCRARLWPAPDPLPEDGRVLSAPEIADGWRLGCRHQPVRGLRAELPTGILAEGAPLPRAAASSRAPAFLAVDLGTTSLEWRLETPERLPLLQGRRLNPQMGAGSDVISRLAVAASPKGRARLQDLILSVLNGLVGGAEAGCSTQVGALCLAANPAMTALALGGDTDCLARAPYSLPLAGGGWESLPGLPPLWIPPLLSPFVGGDISAGYASLALDPEKPGPSRPFLLADLGTNGEFLLAISPGESLAASVALGPALEGIGLSCGTEARPGAVTGFSLTAAGLRPVFFRGIAADPAAGITGTGYLSLLHILRRAGALDEDGRLFPSPLLRRIISPPSPAAATLFPPPAGDALRLAGGLFLSAGDVEEILKVKAAFSLGLRRLLAEAGLVFSGLAHIYVAGALGQFVNIEALETLGFFPPGASARLTAVGNASLDGAALLLAEPGARDALQSWSAGARTLDLACDPFFQRDFASAMRFSWSLPSPGHSGALPPAFNAP
ncbi:MAG: ASKHA domain-containing protein [Desulfovibrio sp.]|nr:ASKHA domain-containing protein [Desulfovibrio sp.]